MRVKSVFAAALMLAACATQAEAPAPQAVFAAMPPPAPASAHQEFSVMLAPGNDPKSGRLIVVATPVAAFRPGYVGMGLSALSPGATSFVAAQEAARVTPAQAVRFDADLIAHPRPLSRMEPGEYWVQVRLDTNRNAAYAMLDAADYISTAVKMTLPSAGPVDVTLRPEREVISEGLEAAGAASRVQVAARPPRTLSPEDEARIRQAEEKGRRATEEMRALQAEADAHTRPLDFVSPSLSEFWGKPIHVRGVVLLPPDYEATGERFPTVYRTEGFGATLASLPFSARRHYTMMKNGDTPPMIRVFLDHSSPWGTHEFADSVNNGPWGQALTEELIPWLETQYKMDGEPSGRFVTGHSSGGWFAMWQIVRYPEVYGGSWARAPDPVDFRSFTGIDIYRAGANAYVRPDGSEQYLVRDAAGKETTSFRQYAQQENVLGDFGGQINSFDWVFSPRGDDGRPQPLFDRVTGAVDPKVADYWRTHYDISAIIKRDWVSLKQVLDGKIHLIMGTVDTFHLNEAAVLLEQQLKGLGAKAEFTWMEGRNHGTLDSLNGDPNWLEKKIAWEMYAVARPKSSLKPRSFVAPQPAP